ncbi:2-hydroxy-3-oxopropionate reductase [Roseovarius sp. ZX-A-9]|uniref:2-hydroxy-3-oxopropionate reductase n=1 Tax=Roseovarius sp. ZX-A-9 TaxID=3014783 RepID=UPI00232B9418|nr:2-hydroxy-3-oxopropionate reductase [Roseovarius sp. ZX-A-9]
MSKIGFIGLGIMGAQMAGHLIDAGHELHSTVHNTPAPTWLVERGLVLHPSAREVTENSDIIITMLPDTPQVEEVLVGADGIGNATLKGKLIIDMSSISPVATADIAAQLEKLGCDFVDAPVSGGEVGAKNATLSIMCGGSDKAFSRALPLFEIMGKNITHVGAAGTGQTAKVANQIIVALNIQAVAEALVFASKAGADPRRVREALMGGFASSKILEVHGERMIDRTFDPGFRIKLHHKDLRLALSSAQDISVSLPNTASCHQLMNACLAQGLGDTDHSALVRIIELLSDHQIDGANGSQQP